VKVRVQLRIRGSRPVLLEYTDIFRRRGVIAGVAEPRIAKRGAGAQC
jgi:hypothetical protein